mgnify:FL=1
MSTPATAVRRRRLLELMAVSASALTGCVRLAPVDPDAGRPTVAAAAAGSGTVSFTDSTGRQVELPREITRVAPASPLADIMLFPIAADEMVGWCSAPGRAAGEILGTKYLELPELGKIDADPADFAREVLLASAPQVIVDVGEWDEEYKAGLDSLQEDLGIPVILIDGALGASGDALRLLGQALGKAELGEQLGAYADGVIGDVRARAAAIPQDRRLRVYYGEGADGLTTLVAGSVHAEVFEMAGAALVTDEGSVRAQGGEGMVSLEQVRGWNPDAIVLGPDSIGAAVAEDASWASLDAVRNGRCYAVAGDPYNWIGRPPGPNRLLGAQWLGSVLYPETFIGDMVATTKRFYSLFYRCELTDGEARGLLSRPGAPPSAQG